MNCYLVMLRHTQDDVPLYITSERDDAFRFAREESTWDAPNHGPDCSTPVCITVVKVIDGRPIDYGDVVRVWEDEETEAESV